MSREPQIMADREQDVADAVLSYLQAVDAGRPPDPAEVLARYPDLTTELTAFFADQEHVDLLVSPLRGSAGDPHAETPPGDGGPPALPGYEVLGELGRSGMGVVYKARQVGLDRIVAVKVIRRRPPGGAEPTRFHAEAQTVARLDHPNIVRVYDSGERDGAQYLVLEHVAGGNLADKLRAGPWPPAAAARLVVQLADAVEYAHRHGVVHRDLKPANVLLTPAGVPKIADFGLSKQMRAAPGGLTHAGDVLGTPAYMAPEQAGGRPDAVGPATDVFGLGAILYDLLTGQPPFRGETLEEVIERAKGGPPPPPRQLNGRVPPALDRVCLKAMATDPQHRYPSAAALAGDLRRYLTRVRRRAWRAAGLAAVVVAGLVAYSRIVDRGQRTEDRNTPSGSPTVPAPPAAELATRAGSILATHCHRCHGADGSIEGGFNFVLDRGQLVARRRLVVPGRPDESRLLRRVESEEMPPEGEAPRPSPDDVAVLRRWVEAGAPEFAAPVPARPHLSGEDVFRLVRDDLEKAGETDRPFYRYFTITHLANAGLAEDGLQTYRAGLSRLVNSLSWRREITVPAAIDPGRTVFRIDLRDYQWPAAVWEAVLAAYPYGAVPPSPLAADCAAATRCPLPVVRADWFVSAAARPPLYHQALQLPGTVGELEKLLRVDVAADIDQYRAARAGFNGSGVANANRLIERHPSNYGAYWRSYDFALDRPGGERNLFQHPLGPGDGPAKFRPDGGEVIFSLPNGLQGYLLADAAGRRIDKAPTDVVKDPRSRDGAVVTGVSCMACHVRGMIAKDDQIRDHVATNPGTFPKGEAEDVRALYPPRDRFAALLRQDADRFAAAALAAGAGPGGTDPVVALASRYDWDLDANLAAAEVGLGKAAFLDGLNRSEVLSRVMGQLRTDGGTVQRPVFEAHFPELARVFQLGTVHSPAEPVVAAKTTVSLKSAVEPKPVFVNSINMKLQRIEAGRFLMGSPPDDPAAGDDERPQHTVTITKPFFLGAYEVKRAEYQAVTGTKPWPGGGTDLPATHVSWADAVAFCEKLSALPAERAARRTYRLPTEAEWEYACRAGSTTAYSFGDNAAELNDHGWSARNASPGPQPVGRKLPNRWGLYDMHGNVAEWCADGYDANFYKPDPATDPMAPIAADLPFAVLRGGSFTDDAVRLRSADRHHSLAKNFAGAENYGFRVVLEADGAPAASRPGEPK